MPEHVVKENECLDTIAFLYGFFPDTLWMREENQKLRAIRETGYQLAPDDVLFIPEKRLTETQCAIDRRHRFKRKGVPAKVRIRLLDILGKPRKNAAYVLEIDPGIELEGTTGEDGMIVHFVPPDAVSGRLTIQVDDVEDSEGEEVYELALSQLRPSSMVLGVQQRLYALGFLEAPLSGSLDAAMVQSLRLFQKFRGIKETGDIDDATLAEFERDFQTR